MNTTGNSSPLEACSVISVTWSVSASQSSVSFTSQARSRKASSCPPAAPSLGVRRAARRMPRARSTIPRCWPAGFDPARRRLRATPDSPTRQHVPIISSTEADGATAIMRSTIATNASTSRGRFRERLDQSRVAGGVQERQPCAIGVLAEPVDRGLADAARRRVDHPQKATSSGGLFTRCSRPACP